VLDVLGHFFEQKPHALHLLSPTLKCHLLVLQSALKNLFDKVAHNLNCAEVILKEINYCLHVGARNGVLVGPTLILAPNFGKQLGG